jgi:hypothetical protein
MLVASLLPLARPEGVFVCLLWGLWILILPQRERQTSPCRLKLPEASSDKARTSANAANERERGVRIRTSGYVVPLYKRVASRLGITIILASGIVSWWFAGLLLTGDPLFILHNWPATWHTDMYGHGTFLSYAQRSQEFAGVILIVPFLLGLLRGFRSWSLSLITSVFLVLFLLHSIFVKYGLFGEAGFPRYMVSVAPAIAVLTLEGWNTIFSVKILRPFVIVAGWVVVIFSILQSVHYLDSMVWARDAVAIDEMANWLEKQYPSLPGLIWSNGGMCIVLQRNLKDSPPAGNREKLFTLLEKAPAGTIVFWDNEIGSNWFGTTSAEIEGRGYKLLTSRHYSLPALIFPPGRFPWIATLFPSIPSREIELSLLKREY